MILTTQIPYWTHYNILIFKPYFNDYLNDYIDIISKYDKLIFSDCDDFSSSLQFYDKDSCWLYNILDNIFDYYKTEISIKMSHDYINIGSRFNQPLFYFNKLLNLKELFFGSNFNQSIEELHNLINLNKLTFGDKFNQSVKPIPNLINLRHLIF